ncbi:hypothetical protein AMTR_s00118p00049530 [Amborella trichopoda]|uniref:Uncharacterized protein n=1 Tax=Amborella trichopoda TaxID=13333 RepID=W1NQ14_AMBTC|nr:hypothetical protein AMTR_s00118p00049530 [Amborella trichopoda]
MKAQCPKQGLVYIASQINEKGTKATIDTGGAHNFLPKGEANWLSLRFINETRWVKAVNSELGESGTHALCKIGTKTVGKTLLAMQLTMEGELPQKARMVGKPKRGDPKDVVPQRSPHMREVYHQAILEPREKATTLGHVKMTPSKARNRLQKASDGWQGQTNPICTKATRQRRLTRRYTDGDHTMSMRLSEDRWSTRQMESMREHFGYLRMRTRHGRTTMRASHD